MPMISTPTSKDRCEAISKNADFIFNAKSWQSGYQWGFSDAMADLFNKNIQLRVMIDHLEQRVENIVKEIDDSH
jgi:hypothetical protein